MTTVQIDSREKVRALLALKKAAHFSVNNGRAMAESALKEFLGPTARLQRLNVAGIDGWRVTVIEHGERRVAAQSFDGAAPSPTMIRVTFMALGLSKSLLG